MNSKRIIIPRFMTNYISTPSQWMHCSPLGLCPRRRGWITREIVLNGRRKWRRRSQPNTVVVISARGPTNHRSWPFPGSEIPQVAGQSLMKYSSATVQSVLMEVRGEQWTAFECPVYGRFRHWYYGFHSWLRHSPTITGGNCTAWKRLLLRDDCETIFEIL